MIPEVQERLFAHFQPFIQAKARSLENGEPHIGLRQLSVVHNDDRIQANRSTRDLISSGLKKVTFFLRESLRQEWMAIPICIVAGFPSTLVTTALMAIVAPWLRYFDFAKSEAGFISVVSVISSVLGYGTYLIAYYAGMLWKERDEWFANGKVMEGGLRRKLKVIQYDFLAHLPSDIWVMPLIGATTGGFFVAGASQFWSILLAHTIADVAYAIKEPFFWHGAKELVSWQEGRATIPGAPGTVGT
jgi:hypothetical protein